MKRIYTLIVFVAISITSYSQIKIADNSASANQPANGPSYIVVSDNEEQLSYLGNSTDFFQIDLKEFIYSKIEVSDLNEIERHGNVVFGRGKATDTDAVDLIIASPGEAKLLDYYTTGSNFPMVLAQIGTGAFFGSGKFEPDNAGRDLIRIDPDLTTVTRPADNVSGGNDLIAKNKYRVQMIPFDNDKLLVKAYRTASDEEYFVWDDTNETYTQITDLSNSDSDQVFNTDWPLGAEMGSKVVFFYKDEIYVSDGTSGGTASIGSVENMNNDGLGAASNFALYGSGTAGDIELYLYEDGGTPEKIDINTGGSSNPVDFTSNGSYVLFIADDGTGYEPFISDGTVSGTKKLIDINTGGASMEASGKYSTTTIIPAGNGFAFGATDGTDERIYFSDGVNVVVLDNEDEYIGQFNNQQYTMYASDEYLYFTDDDKDVLKVSIPDNIYISSAWSNGSPASDQAIYITEDLTISADLTVHSIHIAEGATLTINSGATLTVDNEIYRSNNIVEDGGTLDWGGNIFLFNLSSLITNVQSFLDTASIGFEVGSFPQSKLDELQDSLDVANTVKTAGDNQTDIDNIFDNLHDTYIDTRWERVFAEKKYSGNVVDMLGDAKQAFIKDNLDDSKQIDYMLLGMKETQMNGIRIPIFGEGLEPNKEILDYCYSEAKARGFTVFANPAEYGGARRIANGILGDETGGPGDSVNDDDAKTQIVINRIKDFAQEYQCDFIAPFNEDGNGTGANSWSTAQINEIYAALVGQVNGAKMLGPCTHNIAAGNTVLTTSDINDYVDISTTHNLQFQHDLWDDFITNAGSLPVWDSEATANFKDYDNDPGTPDEEPRLRIAVEAGVEGLVFYNNWSFIDLETGEIDDFAVEVMEYYLDDVVEIASISISGESIVDIGSSIDLTATINPTDATYEDAYWSVSDENLATIDQNGELTGIAEGTVDVIASAIDGSGVADTVEININDPNIYVTNIVVTGDEEMVIDYEHTLTATVTPADATDASVTWSSSDTSIATVDSDGNVTALDFGTTTITATSNDGTDVTGTLEIEVIAALVTEITVSGDTEMVIDYTQTLDITVSPESATDNSYTLSTSDAAIATVSDAGLVTAIAEGTVTITATADDGSGVTGTLEIDVIPALVTEIEITGNTTMTVSDTQTLTIEVSPDSATDNSYTLSTSDAAIATVDSDGLVTAVAVGDVTITATADDASGITGTIDISIVTSIVSVTSIEISGNSTMDDGSMQTLSASVSPNDATDQNINWSSSDDAIATIDSDGVVTAESPGNVTITATASDGSGVTDAFDITVEEVLVSSISVSGDTEILIGEVQSLTTTISPDFVTNSAVTWSSDDSEIATVDSNGSVEAISEGTVTITATAQDGSGVTGTLEIEVGPVLVSEINLTGNTEMFVGETQTLSAEILPDTVTNGSVSWSSSDTDLASVDDDGNIAAIAEGIVTITAIAEDGSGITGTIDIEVDPVLATGITVSGVVDLNIGDNQVLTATVTPSNVTSSSITWTSSNTDVATVESNGGVDAVSEGSVTITATSDDGSNVSGSITISVTPVLVTSITINGSGALDVGETVSYTVTVNPENATNNGVTWSIDDTSILNIDQNGEASALMAGSATISATANDGSGVTSTMTVTVSTVDTESINISAENTSMIVGESQTVTATVLPENTTNKTYAWSTSDDEVLGIDESGNVTALKAGTANVIATAQDGSGITGSIEIEVTNLLITEISITGDATMLVGEQQTLEATIAPADATVQTISWTTSDPDVATITEEGLVTANSIGVCTITASTNDGSNISETFELTVDISTNVKFNEFKLYPNPSNGTLYIQGLGDAKVYYSLITTSGQIIKSGDIQTSDPLELQNLKPGFYIFSIEINNEIIRQRILFK